MFSIEPRLVRREIPLRMSSKKRSFHECRFSAPSTSWHVPTQYQNLKLVGQGGFGTVCSAVDTSYELPVAMKKLTQPFHGDSARRVYRELTILHHVRNHENVLGLLDVFTPAEEKEEFQDVYIVFPLMDFTLYEVIRRQSLLTVHIQFLLYQMLRGLKYMHSAGLIHRDLKPANIGVTNDCDLRLLDLGLARASSSSMTGYVVTRFYMAPEMLWGDENYDKQVDVWAVGCILAEMFTGRVLFDGANLLDQVGKILKIMGKPEGEIIDSVENKSAHNYLRLLPEFPKRNLAEVLHYNGPGFDLLEQMLVLNPKKRITVDAALRHSFLEDYSDPNDEPTALPFDGSFEDLELNVQGWKEKVWDFIQDHTPDSSFYESLVLSAESEEL